MSEKKIPKQRKKQPQVVAVVTPAGVTGSLSGAQRPLIAYLPVRTAQLQEQTPMSQIEYNHGAAGEPVPFDQMDENVSYLGPLGASDVTVVVEKLPASSSTGGAEEDVGPSSCTRRRIVTLSGIAKDPRLQPPVGVWAVSQSQCC